MRFFWQKDEDDSPRREHLRAGEWGEAEAARFLRHKGMKILGRRVRFDAREELDLVAREGEALVFVEVKTRRREDFGAPLAAVNRAKRRALSRAALHYLKRLRYPPVTFRFDVVEVIGHPGADTAPEIRHVPNAFQLDSRYRIP